MNLREKVRHFWFKNVNGNFPIDGYEILRSDIERVGGPSREMDGCPECQKHEWLSRVFRTKIWKKHSCAISSAAEGRVDKQGHEDWTAWHQDFSFAVGVNPQIPTLKIAVMFASGKGAERFTRGVGFCDQWAINFMRALARAGQVEYINGVPKSYDRFDVAIVMNTDMPDGFVKPPIPAILYCHDLLPRPKLYNALKPEFVLTPIPDAWGDVYPFDPDMIEMYWQGASQFFTRPNISGPKAWDILAVGSTWIDTYRPRKAIAEQIGALKGFRAGVSNNIGHFQAGHAGPCRPHGGTVKDIGNNGHHYLNRWSELLGSSKFVIFGRLAGKYQMVLAKHYECLGSGAIPILPDAPDLKWLGVEPWKDYIPLKAVEGNNEDLTALMSKYNQLQHIAARAVHWHKRLVDRMMFERVEELIREASGYKYHGRTL